MTSIVASAFSTAPLPSNLYLTPNLETTILRTNLVIEQRQGLVLILGDIGCGKSSLLRKLEGDLAARDDVHVGFMPEPDTNSPYAFMRSVTTCLGLPPKKATILLKEELREFLFESASKKLNVVLLIDEAHKLAPTLLELIRGILNFESNTAKLIQIVLAGQLELRNKFKTQTARALRSRIAMYSLLNPMTLQEANAMLAHRAKLNGIALPFSFESVSLMYQAALGIPREILNLARESCQMAQLRGLNGTVSDAIVEAIIAHKQSVINE